MRLDRGDTLDVEKMYPSFLLQLGQEQECYDFLKSRAIHAGNLADAAQGGSRDLDTQVQGADVFESIDLFRLESLPLTHLVTLTVLKFRLHQDLKMILDCQEQGIFEARSVRVHRDLYLESLGAVVRARLGDQDPDQFVVTDKIKELEEQYEELFKRIHHINPQFWSVFADSEAEIPPRPRSARPGFIEEAELALYQCNNLWDSGWAELCSAVLLGQDRKNCRYIPVHPSQDATIKNAEILIVKDMRRDLGTGNFFPLLFNPPPGVTKPTDLFTARSIRDGTTSRYLHNNDPNCVLVFTDGACAMEGRHDALGGWAIVYGSAEVANKNGAPIASERLEKRGPFGGPDVVSTSNRAKLRAVLAALRFCDWKDDGVSKLVIASDSSYVVDGATRQLKEWASHGWKTSAGDAVDNLDLWVLLLGEMDHWSHNGVLVEIWKIASEHNREADRAAKSDASGPALANFQDTLISPYHTIAAPTGIKPCTVVLSDEDYPGLDVYPRQIIWGTETILEDTFRQQSHLSQICTKETAIRALKFQIRPDIVIVTETELLCERAIWTLTIDHLRKGTTVIFAGGFGIQHDRVNCFFARAGVPWVISDCTRITTDLRGDNVGNELVSLLPTQDYHDSHFLYNVADSDIWYSGYPDGPGDEKLVTVAVMNVGRGKLGFAGDVSRDGALEKVILAMAGLLE
ncbi:hypothetical protein QBC34DRAFT_440125 [Podospora aff. communis PSN243]|uniref:ribonuclease H n=1 Tax=Podospora aff. communis PSN243 TaxID=3040156 RepID=A0AAV9GGT1_9PEZI|nr:hypothetical protein QBC34DRAFT_440125 [Podospora aff. communis PSN243]